MSLSFAFADGSNTTTAPQADASAANVRVARDRRSRKNTATSASAGLTLSTASSVIGLKAGNHLPQYGHDREKPCLDRPSLSRRISLHNHRGIGSRNAVGPIKVDPPACHVRANALGCHVAVHARDRYASQPRYAKIDTTLPQVPPPNTERLP